MQARGSRLPLFVMAACLLFVGGIVTSVYAQEQQVQIPSNLMNMSVTQLNQQGNQLFDQGNFRQALPYFLAITKKDTTQAGVYSRLSDVEYNLFRLDLAQQYLRKAIELEPNNDDYRARFNNLAQLISTFQEGVDATRNQNYTEALDKFNDVLDQFDGFAPALYQKGLVYRYMGKPQQAADFIRQAIKADPDNAHYTQALENLAKLHFKDGLDDYKRGNLSGAEDNLKAALNIDSTMVDAQYLLGLIARKRGNTTTAIDWYQAALKTKPSDYRVWYALGLAYQEVARQRDALNAYQQATQANPNYAKAWTQQGLIQSDLKQYSGAVSAFQKAIQLDPSDDRAYEGLGIVYMQQGKYQQAVSQFNTAIGLVNSNSDKATLYYRVSNAQHELGHFQEMKSAAQSALKFNPGWAAALINLGGAECHLGNGDAALANWKKATSDSQWRATAEHKIDVYNKSGECD